MKLKISKSQWEEMGKKAGWMKTAAVATEEKGPTEEERKEWDKIIDGIKKRYEKGEITKQQMETQLTEFAKRNNIKIKMS